MPRACGLFQPHSSFFVTCSIHNRFQWQRYSQRCDFMWSMRRITETSSRDDVLHKTWLWHGTSGTDPRVLCTGQDGIDFRRVRHVCLAPSMSSPCHGVHDHGHGCVSYRSPVGWLLWCAVRAWLVYGWHATCGQARDDVGLFYGRGAYFSDSAAYCDESYAYVPSEQPDPAPQQHRQLILAHVLCGHVKEYGTRVDPALKFPPPGFDSVHGGPHKFNPAAVCSCNMTVVYDRTQVYPQYIVTYRKELPRAAPAPAPAATSTATAPTATAPTATATAPTATATAPTATATAGASHKGQSHLGMLMHAWPVVLAVLVMFVSWALQFLHWWRD